MTVQKRSRLHVPALHGALASPAFRLWLTGRLSSLVGEVTISVVIPTMVMALTGSLQKLAAVVTVQSFCQLSLVLVGGLVVDRLGPDRVLLITSSVQAALVAALFAASRAATAHYWYFLAWGAASGVLTALSLPAANAFAPIVLEGERLRSGNSLYVAGQQILQFFLPAAAGYVAARVSSSALLAVPVAGSATFAMSMALVHRLMPERPLPVPRTVRRVARDLVAGFAVVARDRLCWQLTAVIGIYMFGATLIMRVGLAGMSNLVFHRGSLGLGILISAVGAGAFLGSLLGGMQGRFQREGVAGGVLTLLFGGFALAAGAASSLWPAAAALAGAGFCWSAASVLYTTVLQRRTPREVMGRVMGVVTLALVGTEPVAEAIATWRGNALGPRGVMGLSAAAIIAAGCLTLTSPALRTFEGSQAYAACSEVTDDPPLNALGKER